MSCKRDLNAGSQGKGHRVVGDSHNLGVVRHSNSGVVRKGLRYDFLSDGGNLYDHMNSTVNLKLDLIKEAPYLRGHPWQMVSI